jgi:serine/threonine protein kinase
VEDNTLYIFLEYVSGGSITQLIQKFGLFNEQVRRPASLRTPSDDWLRLL